MKQKLSLAATFFLLLGALVLSQMQQVEAPVNPGALLYWIADTERELTRIPMAHTRIPDQQEIEAGERMAAGYRAMAGQASNEETRAIEKYVRGVTARLAANAGRKLPYQTHYVPDLRFMNAFALPGGQMFIGAGLMAVMRSEDELAAVLGHEIEHIDHYHCAERLQWEIALRKIPLGEVFSIPAEVFQAGYSKEQELEADREGVALALAAGYSPAGAIRLFEEFERLRGMVEQRARSPQQEVSQVTRELLRGYFQSHPHAAERIEQIRRVFSRELAAAGSLKPLEFAYVYIRERAGRVLEAARRESGRRRAAQLYREAADLAARSLAQKPDQPEALRFLALARLGLGDFRGASETYRTLVALEPQAADAVRKFADELAARALAAEEFAQAIGLANFSLQLQPNQPGAVNTVVQAQIGLGNLAAAEEMALNLNRLYPQAGAQLAAALVARATTASAAGDLAFSLRLLNLTIRMQPLPATRKLLADTQFAAGDFPAAAANYNLLLLQNPAVLELASRYADALGAQRNLQSAAEQFRAWAQPIVFVDPATAARVRIDHAGLGFLAGEQAPARMLVARTTAPGAGGMAPEHLGRLAWWYGKAGAAGEAATFLRTAVGMRPGDDELQLALGWAELESGRAADSLTRFERASQASGELHLGNSPVAGRALARWSQGQSDAALADFAAEARKFPSWLNLAWVRAIYPQRVAAAVAEIHSARAAQADFDRAHFSAARSAFRALAEKYPADAGLLRRFADAAGAAGAASAAEEFEAHLARVKPASPAAQAQAGLDLAGLRLLAGDAGQADAMVRQAAAPGRLPGSDWLERMAWWYFRTGATSVQMENLLRVAAQQRPHDRTVKTALAWLELERGNLRRAMDGFTSAEIGYPIAVWRLGPTEHRRALAAFESLVKMKSYEQWLNPQWVESLYPAHVVSVVRELQAAYEKRRKESSQ